MNKNKQNVCKNLNKTQSRTKKFIYLIFLAFSCLQVFRIVVVCYSKRCVNHFPRFPIDFDTYSLNKLGKKTQLLTDK